MGSSTFKSVAFGGFDKQDVVRYIEESAKEHAEAVRRLQAEKAELSSTLESLSAEKESLAQQLAQLQEQQQAHAATMEQLRTQMTAISSEAENLRETAAGAQDMASLLEDLRPDAESYRQVRYRVGTIECEAQKRAAALEASTMASLRDLLAEFRTKYQHLTSTFEVTAGHVNSELRKIEVTLTQLPRTMDRPGTELNELAAKLEQFKSEKSR